MVAVTKQLFEAVGLTTDWITQYSVTPTSSVPTILTETVPQSRRRRGGRRRSASNRYFGVYVTVVVCDEETLPAASLTQA